MSDVRTPQCQTPTLGTLRPPSTGHLGIRNGRRPLARTAGKGALSAHRAHCPPPPQR